MDGLNDLMKSPWAQGLVGGVWGTLLAQNDIMTREVQQGRHVHMTALSHIGMVTMTEGFAATAFDWSLGVTAYTQLVSMAAVGVVHYLAHTSTDVHVRQWCRVIADMILPVSRLVNIVCVAAFFYFGNYVMGTAVCAMYAFALIDKAGYLPEMAQKVYYNILRNDYFLLFAQLFITTGITQIFAAIFLAARIAMISEKWFYPEIQQERQARVLLNVADPGRITPQQMVSMLTTHNNNFEIDHTALFKSVPDYRGATPNIDYERVLLDLFTARRETLVPLVRGKCRFDERFLDENYRNPGADPMRFARTSLESLLGHVKRRDFAGGIELDYPDLERKLKILAQYLVDNANTQPAFVDDCIVKLAIEGGGYCQAAGSPTIKLVYREVVFNLLMRDAPEDQKVKLLFYQVLSKQRERIFQAIFLSEVNIWWQWEFTREFMQNRHFYNTLVEFYGDGFGLDPTGSEDDVVAQQAGNDPGWWLYNKMAYYIGKWAVGQSVALKDLMRTHIFDNEYTPDRVVGFLRESTSFEARRPSDNIVPWLSAWIDRQNIEADVKAVMKDELSQTYTITINGEQIQLHNNDQRVFEAMAYDMGILRLRGEAAAIAPPPAAVPALPAPTNDARQPALTPQIEPPPQANNRGGPIIEEVGSDDDAEPAAASSSRFEEVD